MPLLLNNFLLGKDHFFIKICYLCEYVINVLFLNEVTNIFKTCFNFKHRKILIYPTHVKKRKSSLGSSIIFKSIKWCWDQTFENCISNIMEHSKKRKTKPMRESLTAERPHSRHQRTQARALPEAHVLGRWAEPPPVVPYLAELQAVYKLVTGTLFFQEPFYGISKNNYPNLRALCN